MQTAWALGIFLATMSLWRTVFVRHGSIGFWQLAARMPDEAYEWLSSRADWLALEPKDPRAGELTGTPKYVGPFKLWVPSAGGLVLLFAESASIDASQEEFLALYGGKREQPRFPWVSWLAMLHPVAAIVWAGSKGAPLLACLGYGFANLGYVLLVGGIFLGRFGALGFRYRSPTLIAAAAVWLVGTLLSNL